MGEPERTTLQNFAYHPNVANWVRSTSLAQLDGTTDEPPDESPDDFYKSPYHHPIEHEANPPSSDMTSTRQRQQTANGAVRSTTKPSVRSVSGPASSSIAAARAAQLPVNRPTVKSLAQRFNQPSSAESSPASTRVRPVRPASSTRSITDAPAPPASNFSPARPTKEAAYGFYKFNNLKSRERPQPAPASPASIRRTNDRTSKDEPLPTHRRQLSSPTRVAPQRANAGRQPFFGEVVGEHDDLTPGFGIPGPEPTANDLDPIKLSTLEKSTIKLVNNDLHLSPKASSFGPRPARHRKSPSDMTSASVRAGSPLQMLESSLQRAAQRHSPPSRIPVASRRLSAASDSSASNRSSKIASARPSGGYYRTSPSRQNKIPKAQESVSPRDPKVSSHHTRPTISYRAFRERRKSATAAAVGASLVAATTALPMPLSPRLRNSRERQSLSQEAPGSPVRNADPDDSQDYFKNGDGSGAYQDPNTSFSGQDQGGLQFQSEFDQGVDGANETVGFPSSHTLQSEQSTNEQESDLSMAHHESLTVHTTSLHVPQVPAPLLSTTDFEHDESPILGMPGSFMMTPPTTQDTPPMDSGHGETRSEEAPSTTMPPEELLQPRAFLPLTRSDPADAPSEVAPTASSEFGIRESIPIMLGVDEPLPEWAAQTFPPGHLPRLSIGGHRWRPEPLDSSGTISYLDEDDSPIDVSANRDSLRPDDSASVAFYRQTERRSTDWTPKMPAMPESRRMTMDSDAYSVINKVLNLYHQSTSISPEVAHNAQRQVHNVSPVIAQHSDWGSKEATETYLARLLSDATVAEGRCANDASTAEVDQAASHHVPALGFPELDEDMSEPDVGGTAIIFPPESRRYSRGSTTTTIWDEGSRADSCSVNMARDPSQDESSFTHSHLPSSTYAPHPPPKDWKPSYHTEYSQVSDTPPRSSTERFAPPFGSLLPEIEGAGEGLGLSLQTSQTSQTSRTSQTSQTSQQETSGAFRYPPPPRPAYSPPPPPPAHPSIDRAAVVQPYTPSIYHRQPPSSIMPSAPLPAIMDGTHPYKLLHDALNEDFGPDTPEPQSSPHDPTSDATDSNALQPSQPKTTVGATLVVNGTVPENVDPVTQALRQRYRVMEELISTEQLFCVDMMLAYSVFEATSGGCLTDRERRTLFCNSQEIDKLSNSLFQDLKRAARPVVNPEKSPADRQKERAKRIAAGERVPDESVESNEEWEEFKYLSVENDRKTNIGAVMNEHMPRLERLFTTYLLNHGDASELIKSKSEETEVLGWVKACFVHSKDLTNAWDLDSLLVKPVQRLMKYPLLLESLERTTAAEHPDLPAIRAARLEIIEINVRINEAKNRQETLREATKEGKKQKNKGGIESRIGKTFFVKPFSSKTDRSKQQAAAAAIFSDDEYDFLAQKFGGHFFQIQVVIRDIETYLDTMTEFMYNTNCLVLNFIALMESAPSSHPELESTWRRQAMAFFELQNVALEDHKTTVRLKVLKPILELWGLHGRPQKLMDQRKKGLQPYVKYKQAKERNEKVDPKLVDTSESFKTINNTLKLELPRLYDLTKKCVRACLGSFVSLQKDWWKNCQKKILPLLEYEPEHTTSITFDLKAYVDRFHSDFASVEAVAGRLAIANHGLLNDVQNYASPLPSYPDDNASRKSSSRRTESMSSDASVMEPKKRYSGGYASQRGPIAPPRSSSAIHTTLARERAERATNPGSERNDATATHTRMRAPAPHMGFDGAFDSDYGLTSSLRSSLLSPASNPGSSRTSGIFNSALPMSDPGLSGNRDEVPTTPATPTYLDEPEVLFLAASLFEFNIAHDRREGGIPYLVYVPGEIFDVIGMKGELWLARNQDDSTRTVGWIWEKHFARILPEDG